MVGGGPGQFDYRTPGDPRLSGLFTGTLGKLSAQAKTTALKGPGGALSKKVKTPEGK